MKGKMLRILLIVLVVLLIVGMTGFYIYDVVVLDTPVMENLFRTLAVVALLLGTLLRLARGAGRKSLDVYEKAYKKELGSAFLDRPFLRKKLLCACRLYNESNYGKSLKYLYQLLEESRSENDGIPTLFFIALCYTDAGVPDEAIKVYNRILEYSPRNAQIHSNLGMLYINSGDYDMALEHYNRSIEIMPNNYYAYSNRASYYFKIHEFENAIEDAKKALSIKNNGKEAASLLTIIYALKNEPENKEKYYHTAISAGYKPEDLNNAIEYYLNEVAHKDYEITRQNGKHLN